MDTKTMRMLWMSALAGLLAVSVVACGDDDDDDDVVADGGRDGGSGDDDDDDGGVDGGVDGGPPAELGALVPEPGTEADNGGTPPAPFTTSATYIGAVEPGTVEGAAWWDGWTNFNTETVTVGGMTITQAAPDDVCPAGNPTVVVDQPITANTTWMSSNCYELRDIIYVRDGAVLTIQPGTFITGSSTGTVGALVITTEGRLEAVGTAAAPIVFTSHRAPGSRVRGDIAGLVMLGLARINVTGGSTTIEGLPSGTEGGQYGGTNDAHDCGTLRYVRVEYAGFVIGEGNELNAITLGGCGSATDVEFVQATAGKDDGIEFFGGSPRLRNGIAFNGDDDGFDFDQGYNGTVQFGLVYNHLDRGFEWDNNSRGRTNTPRTKPILWNVTVVGNNGAEQEGARLKDGVQGDINNVIFQDFGEDQCVEVQHIQTKDSIDTGDLRIRNSIFSNCETPVRFQMADRCNPSADPPRACPTSTGENITCDTTAMADSAGTFPCVLTPSFTPPWITDTATFGNVVIAESYLEQLVNW